MNLFHSSMLGGEANRKEESGYFNGVTAHFKAPARPRFSVQVNEPNGKGPNDPTFLLYHYMLRVDGDEAVGHSGCIADLEVSYTQALAAAVRMGLTLGEDNSQFLELRSARDRTEPGWKDRRLRGKTYWRVVESLKGRNNEYYVDAVTGKALHRLKGTPDSVGDFVTIFGNVVTPGPDGAEP